MWRDRLIRFFIIILVVALVAGVVQNLATKQQEASSFSIQPVKKKVEDFGEQILGEAVKRLPKAPDLSEVGQKDSESKPEENEQSTQGGKPISQPVQNVQNQTQVLIESIKKLPQDQIEAIKKQIYKEFCEKLLGE